MIKAPGRRRLWSSEECVCQAISRDPQQSTLSIRSEQPGPSVQSKPESSGRRDSCRIPPVGTSMAPSWAPLPAAARRPGRACYLSPLAASCLLFPAFSICCPAPSVALSTPLPICSPGPSYFWAPNSAESNVLRTNAVPKVVLRFENFINWYGLDMSRIFALTAQHYGNPSIPSVR